MAESARYKEAIRATAPRDAVLNALELTLPGQPPVRVVNDVRVRTIDGAEYLPLRFDLRLPTDPETGRPSAEIAADHLGAVLTSWLDAAGGAGGGTARLIKIAESSTSPDWQRTLDVLDVEVQGETVIARLGYDAAAERNAVAVRFGPDNAPGLF